jgi:general secretion pathway protein D
MFRHILFTGLCAALPLAAFAQQPAPVVPVLPAAPAVPPANILPGEDLVQFSTNPNSDVKEVLRFYIQLTGRRIIYDVQTQGPVPIEILRKIPKDEAIRIIETALLMNGFSLIPTENKEVWKVFGVGKNPRTGGVPIYSEPDQLPETEQIVSFLFQLDYADPTELAQTLTQAFPANQVLQGASFTALPKAGALLVTENTAIIRQVIQIVQKLDHPAPKVESRFFKLQRADAKDIQEKLTDILTKKDASAPAGAGVAPVANSRQVVRVPTTPEGLPLPAGAPVEGAATTVELNIGPTEENFVSGKVKITADVRTNRIHVIARPDALREIGILIDEFDANVPFGEPSTYQLLNVQAADVFQVLVKAVSDPGAKDEGGTNAPGGNNRPTGGRSAGTGNSLFGGNNSSGTGSNRFGDTGGVGGGGSPTLSESLNADDKDLTPEAITIGANTRVIADKRANAIIVMGNNDVKEKLFAVIKQLDVRAPQVMLQTCIGQLSLNEDQQFGVNYIANLGRDQGNFAGTTTTGTGGTPTTTGGAVTGLTTSNLNIANLLSQEQIKQIAVGGASGLSGFFTAGNAFNAIVTALESTNNFKVTSRPVIFTSNNKKAIISSGEEIAVPTSIQSGFGGTNTANNGLVTNSSISFKNVALTLEVIPLINSDKEVYMDIVQKIDEQSGSDTIDGNQIPRIASRVLKTTVTVPNNATLVLGGLIKHRDTKTKSGIPLLMDIPLLGGLFRSTRTIKTREELVILIRPVVTITPIDSIRETERQGEFLHLEPDLEHTLMDPNLRQRTAPEELLRKPAPLGLREYSARPAFVSDPPKAKRK